jgi:hypothetical protein
VRTQANFLGAIEGGARQVEVTINGIGERAGNAAMEEVVMALHVRKQYYNPMFGRDPSDQDALTNINMKEIYRSSKLLTSMTGMFVQVCVVYIYIYIYIYTTQTCTMTNMSMMGMFVQVCVVQCPVAGDYTLVNG